jgi:hypothetical protein
LEEGLPTGHFVYPSKTSSFRFPIKGALSEAPYVALSGEVKLLVAFNGHKKYDGYIVYYMRWVNRSRTQVGYKRLATEGKRLVNKTRFKRIPQFIFFTSYMSMFRPT